MHSYFFKSETETSKTRSLCTKVGPLRLGWAQLLCSPARRVAASSPRVQGWYNCVSAQRGAECCLNINKLSHSRETPALVTTLTRNTSPAAAGGSFDQHFQFSSTSFCWTQFHLNGEFSSLHPELPAAPQSLTILHYNT